MDDGVTCEICSNIDMNCVACENDECTSCVVNFFVDYQALCTDDCGEKLFGDEESGQCQDCPMECSTCDDLNYCTGCEDGWQLDYMNTCQPCEDLTTGCATCEQDVCNTCTDGLYLDVYAEFGTVCVDECEDKFYGTDDFTCENCDVDCAICTSEDACETCIPGYANIDFACYQCPENCLSCADPD